MLDDSVEQDELEEFRRRWKQEVEAKKFVKNSGVQPQLPKPKAFRPSTTSVLESHSAEPDDPPKRDRDSPVVGQKTSLEYYMTAIEKEKVGNLSEALTNYRHAFKLDPDADDSYRQHWQQHIAPHAAATSAAVQSSSTVKHEDDFERHVHLGDDYEKPNGLAPNDTLENLLAQLRGMQLECTPLKEDKPIFIAMLPNEVLLYLLKHVIVDSVASVAHFALVCRKFLLVSRDQTLWRHLCEHAYHDPKDHEEAQIIAALADEPEPRRTQFDQLRIYGGDWRRMYIERPRLRFEGVYISVCHYLRPGSSENSWNQPIHLVTYYRYLRFYPDGTVVKHLTTDEPSAVVRLLQPTLKRKSLFTGTYSIKDGGVLELELLDADRPRETFFATMQICSTHRGRQNKLEWVEYCSYNSLRESRTVFPLKMMKPYFFSVVKSYRWW